MATNPQSRRIRAPDATVPTGDAGEPTATATSITSFKPKKPKFGGIKQVGTDTWAVWTGGKPQNDYLELENTDPTEILEIAFDYKDLHPYFRIRVYRSIVISQNGSWWSLYSPPKLGRAHVIATNPRCDAYPPLSTPTH